METTPSLVWQHVAAHPDISRHTALVDAVLDSDDTTSAAALLCGGNLTDADALRAAKVLAPTRGAALDWQASYDLAAAALPPAVQRHLARHVGHGLVRIAAGLTDPEAVSTLVTRALPTTPPVKIDDADGRRHVLPAAVQPLLALESLIDDAGHDELLLAADVFSRTLHKITHTYTGSPHTRYAERLTAALLTLAGRHPGAFCAAAAALTLPHLVLRPLASQRWLDADLVDQVWTHTQSLMSSQTSARLGWNLLRNIEPLLDEARREEIRERLRTTPLDAQPFRPWATKLLTSETSETEWVEASIDELLAKLEASDYEVPDHLAAAVVARPDLPDRIAAKVAVRRTVTPALLTARNDRLAVILLAKSFDALTRMTAPADDSPVTDKWTEEQRLDLVRDALAMRFTRGRERNLPHQALADSTVLHQLKPRGVAAAMGPERTLSLPWWIVAAWACTDPEVSRWVAEALLDVLADPGTRQALLRLVEDGVANRTESSLLDLVAAAAATAA